MKSLKPTGLLTSALLAATLVTSPLALADRHGDRDGQYGKRHHGDICEKLASGDWQQKREQMREKYNQRHEAMAERLQLTDEQRQTWDEIRNERREEHHQRYEKLKERCENANGA